MEYLNPGWAICVMTYPPPVQNEKLLNSWQELRRRSSARSSHEEQPPWESPPTSFPNWSDSNELELNFQFYGNLGLHQWDICIADENGWETAVPDYMVGSALRDPRGNPPIPGWLSLGSAYPRHSKKIHICFHANPSLKPEISDSEQRAPGAELVLANPFYEGPAPAPAPRPCPNPRGVL